MNRHKNVWKKNSFFFFHWHYSPLWALACRTMFFHFFLSATNSLHLLTPSTWRSHSTSSFHLFLGLPLLLVPSSSWVKTFLGTLSFSILSRWTNQLILCPLSILLHFLLCSEINTKHINAVWAVRIIPWRSYSFHWHYSPLWALACRTYSFHFSLSATKSLHLLTPSSWRSLSTSSFHLFLGLPLLLVPSSSWVKTILGTLSSSIPSRWPNQLIPCPFTHFTIFYP